MRNFITEDVDEFGKVGAETSYLQSQMHSEYDSAESIEASDLEDGELRKILASPLYRQDREDCKSSRKSTATVKLAAMFSSGSKEPGNQLKSSNFTNTDPLNLGRSLLKGNNDHLLSQARSELMKQEHQVGSLRNCFSERQQQAYSPRIGITGRATRETESRREQVRPQEKLSLKEKVLRDTQIGGMHEMEKCRELKNYKLTKSQCKN